MMTSENLMALINEIVETKAEYQHIELKAAKKAALKNCMTHCLVFQTEMRAA